MQPFTPEQKMLQERHDFLDDSVNVIGIKVAESDVRFPIYVYGTVLARDGYDHRCIYVFKRGRDDPQRITRKIKGDGAVDEDFSKGLIACGSCRQSTSIPTTYSLRSYLSTMGVVCMLVPYALEATTGVNFLNGKSTFTGKILASTSASATIKMVLYDNKVDGTKKEFGSGGSVSLRRNVVAIQRGEDLVLYFCVHDSYNKSRRLKFVIRNGVEERTCNLGTYKRQVKIIWKGVFNQQHARLRFIGDHCHSRTEFHALTFTASQAAQSAEQKMLHERFLRECPYMDLIRHFWSWEKVVAVLNVARLREITERNPKTHWKGPTRFCGYNIAFFDFERESRIVHGPLFCDIPPSRHDWLDDSVNVIGIKVAEFDVRFPIDVYGTVLARDGYDHRCIYVFKRGRDDPQRITRKNRMLALTGPNRALGGIYYMFFEFHLKIKGDGAVDEDFSKG
ncbi:hypothetical protein C2845_PM07G39010 [Panicum miliaceum]|uniref:DUF6598 domain-containing protein n=1 Tax=Panicum miliaceum TaxID=4540 RepID=A0A3L6SQK3_PANMI|nr:hypothetical protein C2845_PM07G39010 [Panicum miliaceum]